MKKYIAFLPLFFLSGCTYIGPVKSNVHSYNISYDKANGDIFLEMSGDTMPLEWQAAGYSAQFRCYVDTVKRYTPIILGSGISVEMNGHWVPIKAAHNINKNTTKEIKYRGEVFPKSKYFDSNLGINGEYRDLQDLKFKKIICFVAGVEFAKVFWPRTQNLTISKESIEKAIK